MAGPGDERAAAAGRGHGELRASHADREQAIDVLKAAFVAERLTKDELDVRVGQALVSRTYADLAALTADIPAGVPEVRPPRPAIPARQVRSYPRRWAVGWAACVMIPLVLLVSQGFGPAFILGFFAAMMIAGSLIAAASEQKRSRGQLPQGPAPGAGGQESRRAGAEQLPPFDHGQPHSAEAARNAPQSPGSRSAPTWRPRGHRYTIGYAST